MTKLTEGTSVGRYRIVRWLGSGSMADVYEAEESEPTRRVALKILPLQRVGPEETVQRFRHEILAVASLGHPSIVPIYHVGFDHWHDVHYVSMRLLTGGDLAQRIAEGMSAMQALKIVRDLADACGYAHAHGLIHRDIKPSNVLFDEHDVPVLTDFGIAKTLNAEGSMATGMTTARITSMSPEEASGRQVDQRTDLYRLGIMLFEMISGRPPFESENPMATMYMHLTAPLPPLPESSRWMSSLVDSLAAVNPDDRPVDAKDAIRRIDALLGSPESVALVGIRGAIDSERLRLQQFLQRRPSGGKKIGLGSSDIDFGLGENDKYRDNFVRDADLVIYCRTLEREPRLSAIDPPSTSVRSRIASAVSRLWASEPLIGSKVPASPARRPANFSALESAAASAGKYIRYGKSIEVPAPPRWKRWLPRTRLENTTDPIDCSLYGPHEMAPGSDSVLQAVLHLPTNFIEADRLAKDIDSMARHRGRKRLEMEVSRGARIRFRLQAHELKPEPEVQHLIWRGITESVQFRIRAPSDSSVTSCIARLQVDVDGVPVGVIQFPIRVTHPAAQPENTGVGSPRAYRFRKAFISYAKEDRIEVLKCVQVLPKVGIEFYQDILHVEPGERWEQSLYKHIDTSDVFLLFWSQAAKQSQWVMKEVEYALRRSTDGPDCLPEIRPVMLEGPPPVQPPDWLAHLHFNDPLSYVLSGERAAWQPRRPT
ncbi:MAG: protein kinase domain-containing protein [Panacagrimonas sp.]